MARDLMVFLSREWYVDQMPQGLRQHELNKTGSSWTTSQHELWWEDIIDDWIVSLRLAERDGHLIATEVRIFPDDGDPHREAGEWDHNTPKEVAHVPSDILRKANVATQVSKARAALARDADTINWDLLKSYQDLSLLKSLALDAGFTDLTQLDKPTHAERRPGRRGHPDEHYLRFAAAYEAAFKNPETTHKPIAAVAEQINESRQYVSDMIAESRKRGLLLPAPSKGQPGGELTQNAHRLLRELRTREDND